MGLRKYLVVLLLLIPSSSESVKKTCVGSTPCSVSIFFTGTVVPTNQLAMDIRPIGNKAYALLVDFKATGEHSVHVSREYYVYDKKNVLVRSRRRQIKVSVIDLEGNVEVTQHPSILVFNSEDLDKKTFMARYGGKRRSR